MSDYKGPLADYERYKSSHRHHAGSKDRSNSSERTGAPVLCRIGGCSSPVVGGKGARGELCSVHLRLLAKRLDAERKIRKRL